MRKEKHVRLFKETPEGKVGTVVPIHSELKNYQFLHIKNSASPKV